MSIEDPTPDPEDDPTPDPKPEPGPKDDWTPPSKADWDNIQRRAREAETERKRLADEKAARERKEAEDKGEFEKLAKEAEERATKAEARAERVERETRVSKIASRLRFRDADDVLHHLSEADTADDSSVEKALKKLAEAKPYLITDADKRPQRDLGSGDRETDDDTELSGTARLARAYAQNNP